MNCCSCVIDFFSPSLLLALCMRFIRRNSTLKQDLEDMTDVMELRGSGCWLLSNECRIVLDIRLAASISSS